MKIKHPVEVKNNKIEGFNKSNFNQDLKRFEGKKCYLVLEEQKSKRSTNQNSYYWGIVLKTLPFRPNLVEAVNWQEFKNQ